MTQQRDRGSCIDEKVAKIVLIIQNVGYLNSSKEDAINKCNANCCSLNDFLSFQLFLCSRLNENWEKKLVTLALFHKLSLLKKYICSIAANTVIILLHAIKFTIHNNRVILYNILHPVWVLSLFLLFIVCAYAAGDTFSFPVVCTWFFTLQIQTKLK